MCPKGGGIIIFFKKNLYLTSEKKPQRLFITNKENMKKYIVLLLLLVGSSTLIFAQKTSPLPPSKKSTPSSPSTTTSVASRVSEIQKWYAEIQAIGLKNCTSKTYTVYEDFGEEKYPYGQSIQRCNLNPTYTLLNGDFSGHEWAENVRVYLKNDKIFFVFITAGDDGGSAEIRYYCNEDEKIIKELRRDADLGEELTGPNSEVKANINQDIRTVIDFDRFNRIQR